MFLPHEGSRLGPDLGLTRGTEETVARWINTSLGKKDHRSPYLCLEKRYPGAIGSSFTPRKKHGGPHLPTCSAMLDCGAFRLPRRAHAYLVAPPSRRFMSDPGVPAGEPDLFGVEWEPRSPEVQLS